MKSERKQIVFNNLQRQGIEGIWSREYSEIGNPPHERCLHSVTKKGNKKISISYFTSNNGSGYDCSLYEGNQVVKSCVIVARNIQSAERQAMELLGDNI